ncbi:MAG TPA: orotidine-5'-phosphate decarboxylase [Terriglobales bacterium]|jgi:orotidine-5'-phosphate decarboxylase
MNPADRIVVALDYPDASSALKLVNTLGESISFYKIGLQLFTAEGTDVVRAIKERGKRVFLDLKFHDIPNTVAGAVASVSKLGVDMLTVHAGGGTAMMRAAVDAAAAGPLVLGVTVLTSISAADLLTLGVTQTPAEYVHHLAQLASEAGCGGIVCSPEEVAAVREVIRPEMKTVVPGIRPAGAAAGDQARIATPADAVARGADYLVIGRPITAAADPQSAVRDIVAELTSQPAQIK